MALRIESCEEYEAGLSDRMRGVHELALQHAYEIHNRGKASVYLRADGSLHTDKSEYEREKARLAEMGVDLTK